MSIYLLDTIANLSVNNLSASNLANVAYSGSFNDLRDVPVGISLSLPTSANWNSTYTTVQNNSATWSSVANINNFNGQYSALGGLPTFNQVAFDGRYSSLSGLPSLFNGQYSALQGLPDSLSLPASANWNSNYSTVLANSALWNSVGTTVSIPTSANWDSTYTTVLANSAGWGASSTGGSTQLNISSNYTLALTDNNNTVRTTTTSASPSLILSIPSYSSVAFPVGSIVTIIQGDTGSITLSATPGVSFVTKEAVKNQTFNKGSVVYAIKTQTNEWLLTGDLGIQGAYFYASSSGFPDNRWYNVNSWYGDLNRTLRANILPNSNTDVVILGTIGAYADIDRNDWVQPKSIDTGNTSVTFTSQLSGNISINITGIAIFEGNATYNK